MTTEQLMTPRVEVMYSHPHSPIKRGEVLTMLGDVYCDEQAGYSFTPEIIAEYPHLFRLLQWYDSRNIADMPEYVKYSDKYIPETKKDKKTYNPKQIFNVGNWYDIDKKHPYFLLKGVERTMQATWYNVACFQPATLTEYNEFINKNTTP